MYARLVLALLILAGVVRATQGRYSPTWASLDSRPIPPWYDDAKFGVFVHWGVYSVPSLFSEWFWYTWKGPKPLKQAVEYMSKNYPRDFTYPDFAHRFTADLYDPNKWVDIFKAAGARFVIFTSKHHEGFTNWPSKYSFNWNAKAIGPHRDVLGEFANAIRRNSTLHFGLYHSLYEWFHPLYLQDKANHFRTQEFVRKKTIPELYELINIYKPELIWSDGDWEAHSDYWTSKQFLAYLFNDSPVKDYIVVNDRWGTDSMCKHGSYLTCTDRFNPGKMLKKKWEGAFTLDKVSWGFRRDAKPSEILSLYEIVSTMAAVVSCGGNFVLNVGPTSSGIIAPIFEERFREIGAWLKVNGEAIYSTHPWRIQNDTAAKDVWYTRKGVSVYAIVLRKPPNGKVVLRNPRSGGHAGLHVFLLGYKLALAFTVKGGVGVSITLPNFVAYGGAFVLKLVGFV